MAGRSNKFTIHVQPQKRLQTVSIRATGRFGKTALTIPPTFLGGQPLAPSTDEKAYWSAVLTTVQAMVLSL